MAEQHPHACLGLPALGTLGKEERTQVCPVPSGTIMVSKYMVWFGRKRERQNDLCPVDKGRGEGREWAEVSGLLAIWSYGDVRAWAAAKSHVLVHDPAVPSVCVDVHDSCYHQGPEERAAQNWPCPSPAAALGRAGPEPRLGSTVELTLSTGCR